MVGPMLLLKPIKHKKTSQTAQEAIVEFIQGNRLAPGTKLPPDRELAASLNCSRTAVREALKGLETLGMIDMRVGKGIFVSRFGLAGLLERFCPLISAETKDHRSLEDARLAIETGIVALAVDRAGKNDILELQKNVDRMKQARDPDEHGALDIQFHEILARIAKSPLLEEFSKILRTIFKLNYEEFSKAYREKRPEALATVKTTLHEHQTIVSAIQSRDKPLAIKLITKHLAPSKKRTLG